MRAFASLWVTVLALLMPASVQAAVITFTSTALGGNLWRNDYIVQTGPQDPPVDEFTIYFSNDLYANLVLDQSVPGWDILVVQPDSVLTSDGFVDLLALNAPLAANDLLSGLSIRFNYLGSGTPPSQAFEIVDPLDFSVISSGMAQPSTISTPVPAPDTLALVLIGLACSALLYSRDAAHLRGRYESLDISAGVKRQRSATNSWERYLRLHGIGYAAMLLVACGGESAHTPNGPKLAATLAVNDVLTVTQITKVAETRIGRTLYEYKFVVSVSNSSDQAQSNVFAILQQVGSGTTVVQNKVLVGTVPAKMTITTAGTVTVRHDRTLPFSFDGWIWRFEADESPSVTKVLSASDSVLILPDLATVDFAGHQNLQGKVVTLSLASDAKLKEISDANGADLEVEFGDDKVLKVETAISPDHPVSVTWSASSVLERLKLGQSVLAYGHAYSDDVDGDGANTVLPLLTTVDFTARTAQFALPPTLFQRTQQGTYTATVILGQASTFAADGSPTTTSSATLRQAASQPASAASAVIIAPSDLPCPLPSTGCTETSRYNPLRTISVTSHRGHNGIDLRAQTPIQVRFPIGGRIVKGFTKAQYDARVAVIVAREGLPPGSPCVKTIPDCLTINDSAGISLTVAQGFQKVRLFHLSDIDGSLLNPDKTLKIGTATNAGQDLALTGTTGMALKGAPHLHLELLQLKPLACHNTCQFVFDFVDPFPAMVKQFKINKISGPAELVVNENYQFQFEAFDSNGQSVSSNVNSDREWDTPANVIPVPYSPVRKICLSSSPVGTLDLTGPAQSWEGQPTGAGQPASKCFAWKSIVEAKGTASWPDATVVARFTDNPLEKIETLSELSAVYKLEAGDFVVRELTQPAVSSTTVGVYAPSTPAHACSWMVTYQPYYIIAQADLVDALSADVAASGHPWSYYAGATNLVDIFRIDDLGWYRRQTKDASLGCQCDLSQTYISSPTLTVNVYRCSLTKWLIKHDWDPATKTLYLESSFVSTDTRPQVSIYGSRYPLGVYDNSGVARPAACYPGIGSAGTICLPSYYLFTLNRAATKTLLGQIPPGAKP